MKHAVAWVAMDVPDTVDDESVANLLKYILSVFEEDPEMKDKVIIRGVRARTFVDGEIPPDPLSILKEEAAEVLKRKKP